MIKKETRNKGRHATWTGHSAWVGAAQYMTDGLQPHPDHARRQLETARNRVGLYPQY
ncbi:hypothetical protein [Xenorhabdus szentirmaii]|uniref:hypothetical protein n=1 Tax=Xenorhabdus szentirmaii TaxID=290112 RepID=UPI0019C8DB35|nr:hypothetical protein [Xenorhabdus sp. 5]MBD2823777.1 hypothetical protein [Xenorhabdus sp. 5]